MSRSSRPAAAPPEDADPRPADIEAALVGFLTAYHPAGARAAGRLAHARNLWREVGSLTLLQLVAFVEDKFAVRVRPIDFAPQHFESVATIARLIEARLGAARRGDPRR